MADGNDERQKLRQLIQRAGVAMLITLDDAGAHAARPMLPLLLDRDAHIYFLTHRQSRKVHELTARPRIGLTVTDSHDYLFVTGRADVVREEELIRRLWQPTYRAWFPGGEDDAECIALRVTVERIDYWEPPRSRAVRVAQAAMAIVMRRPIDTPKKTIEAI